MIVNLPVYLVWSATWRSFLVSHFDSFAVFVCVRTRVILVSVFTSSSSDPNSSSSRNIKVLPPVPPPTTSSSEPRPAADGDKEEEFVLSGSCDQQRCHGRGRCVVAGCHCRSGFKGEFCQEAARGRSHGAALLGGLVIAILLAAATFLLLKRYH